MRAFRFILAALILLAAFGLPRLARTAEGTKDTAEYPEEEMKAFLLSRDYPSDYATGLVGAVNISLDPNAMLSLKTEAVDPAVIHAVYTR